MAAIADIPGLRLNGHAERRLPGALAHSFLCISLGRFSTAAEVDWFSERLREVVSRLHGGSGL